MLININLDIKNYDISSMGWSGSSAWACASVCVIISSVGSYRYLCMNLSARVYSQNKSSSLQLALYFPISISFANHDDNLWSYNYLIQK